MTILAIAREAAPELNAVDDKALYNALLMWLFRGLNYNALGSKLSKAAKTTIRTNDVTNALKAKGYVIKQYKVWLFYIVKHNMGYVEAAALARKWEIHDEDVRLFTLVQVNTLAYLKRLAREYVALTMDSFNRVCNHIITETCKGTRRFAWAKLRFIERHQRTGLDLDDLVGEMEEKGIQGMMLMYPLIQTKTHAVNIVKRVIRNTGLNLIQKFTRKKNSALTATKEGGNESRVLDIDNLPIESIPAAEPDRKTSDLFLDFKRLMTVYKGGRRIMLGLLAGLHNVKFSKWLADVKGIATPNDELIDRLQPARYMELCREFMGVSVDACTRFINVVRQTLKVYAKPGMVAA